MRRLVHPCTPVFPTLAVAMAVGASALAHAEVTASNAWVRGMVPAQTSTGAFMTLTSTVDAKLLSVSTPVARMVEIHETKMMNGANHMHEVESVELPAGKPVSLSPGGHHVMLMGMVKAVKPGDMVPLVLAIEEKGGKRVSVEVKAEVRPLGAK
jgi:copper(I)-binding protein